MTTEGQIKEPVSVDVAEVAALLVDASREDFLLAKVSDNTWNLRKTIISVVEKAIHAERERCAAIADAAAAGRDYQRADANAQNDKRAARDFEGMKIEAIEIAAAIRKGGAV